MTTGSFPHDNFSSVYWIFTKLDHMIALWKGKNPIYFGVIRSNVKVTVTINIIFYRLIIYIDGHILWCTHFLFKSGGTKDHFRRVKIPGPVPYLKACFKDNEYLMCQRHFRKFVLIYLMQGIQVKRNKKLYTYLSLGL